jgi:uncharacterized protein YkwD
MSRIRPLLVTLIALSSFAPAIPALAQSGCRAFPETGHQACGRILSYWDANGGLSVFGYPIADQAAQPIEGQTFQAQWFERNRLELHPENAAPYDVLLGRLGADALDRAGRDWTRFPKGDPAAPHYFAATGHAIDPRFWPFWSSHGLEFDGQPGVSERESLALFGLPLSEPAPEISPTDGNTYVTQWFERARFELHPENAGTPYEVLLGLLGAELSPSAPQPAPPTFATRVVDLVNQERLNVGCTTLAIHDTLMRVAQAHAQDMADNDIFDHTGSDGRSSFQRILDAGYSYRLAAENIAAGADTPVEVVALWMDSPGHRANILNCALRETGVGYVADSGDPLNYGTYWVQTFGTR